MRQSRLAILLLAIALLVGMVLASSATADRPANPRLVPVQLALGDSWAAGVGATDPKEHGYVPQLYEKLLRDYDCPSAGDFREAAAGCPRLELENLAVGGATTDTMVATQFPEAISLLESHNGDGNPFNDVGPVTVHIGGNDVTNPIIAACVDFSTFTVVYSEACVGRIQFELSDFEADVNAAMATLRDAAGDGTIVIGTYDNPIESPFCGLHHISGGIELGALVLEGGVLDDGTVMGVNNIIRSIAEFRGVAVADVYGDFDPINDWFRDPVTGVADCLHPDDSGYVEVTAAFVEVLGPLLDLN
jgi:GDSL-like Lipase/Acylhydrolase family